MIRYLLLILLSCSVSLAMENAAHTESQLMENLKTASVILKKDQSSTIQFLKRLNAQEKMYLCKVYSALSQLKNSNNFQHFWQVIDQANDSSADGNSNKNHELLNETAAFFEPQHVPFSCSQFLQDALIGSCINVLEPITNKTISGEVRVVDDANIILSQSSTYGIGSLLVLPRNKIDDTPLKLTGHQGRCYAITVTDKYIIEGGWGRDILVWGRNKQQEKPLHIWKGSSSVCSLLVHKNWLIVSSVYRVVIYDLDTFEEYKKFDISSVSNMRIESNLLYVTTYHNGVYIFDLDFNQQAHLKPNYYSEKLNNYFRYSFFATREHNGFLVATSSDDILLWKLPVENNAKPYAILPSNVNTLWYLEIYKNLIIVGGKKGIIELWDINNLNKKTPTAVLHVTKDCMAKGLDWSRFIGKLWVSPEGLLFSSSYDGLIKVWSLDVTGDVKEPIAVMPTEPYLRSKADLSVYFDCNKELFVTSEFDNGLVEMWNISALSKLQQLLLNDLSFLERQLLLDIDNARKINCKITLSQMQKMVLAKLLGKIKTADSSSAKAIKTMLLNYIKTEVEYTFSF